MSELFSTPEFMLSTSPVLTSQPVSDDHPYSYSLPAPAELLDPHRALSALLQPTGSLHAPSDHQAGFTSPAGDDTTYTAYTHWPEMSAVDQSTASVPATELGRRGDSHPEVGQLNGLQAISGFERPLEAAPPASAAEYSQGLTSGSFLEEGRSKQQQQQQQQQQLPSTSSFTRLHPRRPLVAANITTKASAEADISSSGTDTDDDDQIFRRVRS